MREDLAGTLRLASTSQERRDLLRHRVPTRDDVVGLVAEARSWRRRDPGTAARLARAALVVARAAHDRPLAGEAFLALGQAELLLGKARQALRRQRAAASRVAPAQRGPVAVETAATLMLLGYESEARSALAAARRLATGRDPRLVAVIDLTEANLLMRLDRATEALELYGRARRRVSRLKGAAALASIDTNRATALANLHRYDEADRLYERARRVHLRLGQDANALQIDYNRAYLQFQRGQLDRALREMMAVRERYLRSGDDRHVGLCDLDLAEMNLRLDDAAKAADYAAAATATLSRLGLAHDAARARLFHAVAQRSLGNVAAAAEELATARDALRDVGVVGWEAVALFRLAEIDAEQGLLDRAGRRARDAADCLIGLGFLDRGGRATVLAARVDLLKGDVKGACARLEGLSRKIRGAPIPWLACEVHREWARALAGTDARAALRHAQTAVRLLERHGVAAGPDERPSALLRDARQTYEVALRLVLEVGGRGALDTAYRLARRLAARDLGLPRGAGAAGPGGGPVRGSRSKRTVRSEAASGRTLARRAAALGAELDALRTRMPPVGEKGTSAEFRRRLERAIADREARLRSCLARSRADDRADPESPARVRAALPRDTTLVEFIVLKNETLCFVTAAGRLSLERVRVSREQLESRVRECILEASDPLDQAGAASLLESVAGGEACRRLRTLFAPVSRRIKTPRVALVTVDVLRAAPFPRFLRSAKGTPPEFWVVPSPAAYPGRLGSPGKRSRRGR